MAQVKNDIIRRAVREQYGKISEAENMGCCGTNVSTCCANSSLDVKNTAMHLGYSNSEVNQVPEGANMGLGCGNPKALASLKAGETVLDLGSGGGFDAFLAANEVGSSGYVIGVDMTPEMVSKSRSNAEKSQHRNVDFRLGEIEYLPVANESIDVIISNCVINLSPDKQQVFHEAFRVLKKGGRLAISDIVATASIPEEYKNDMELYCACLTGASFVNDIEDMLKKTGFTNIVIKSKDDSKLYIKNWAPGSNLEDYVVSATIEACKI